MYLLYLCVAKTIGVFAPYGIINSINKKYCNLTNCEERVCYDELRKSDSYDTSPDTA